MAGLVSMVFSFRNEEENLEELIRRTVNVLEREPEDYEMIFVNDDSSDRSADVLEREREKNRRIKIINMSRRFGVSECVVAGFAYTRGDAVIYMDADLQDPPELIPTLLEKWRSGAEVVHTIRIRRHGENKFKMLLVRLAYLAIAKCSEIPLAVEGGDYKLLSRRVADILVRLKESDPYLRGLAASVGFKQTAVEYERQPRAAGRAKITVLGSTGPWKMLVSGLTSFSFVPIYCVLGTGVLGLGIVGLLVCWALLMKMLGNRVGTSFWLGLLVVFCWASLMFALGLVAIYVMRIYKDVRGRPLYIVRDTVGFED